MFSDSDAIIKLMIIGFLVLVIVYTVLSIASWAKMKWHRVDVSGINFYSPAPPPPPPTTREKAKEQQDSNYFWNLYDNKRFLAIYNEEKNNIHFIPEETVNGIYIQNGGLITVKTTDDSEHVVGVDSHIFYTFAAEVSQYFEEYAHCESGIKTWLAVEIGLGSFASMPRDNEFAQIYERAMKKKDNNG